MSLSQNFGSWILCRVYCVTVCRLFCQRVALCCLCVLWAFTPFCLVSLVCYTLYLIEIVHLPTRHPPCELSRWGYTRDWSRERSSLPIYFRAGSSHHMCICIYMYVYICGIIYVYIKCINDYFMPLTVWSSLPSFIIIRIIRVLWSTLFLSLFTLRG